MPGLTAYFGLLEIGKPKAGETVYDPCFGTAGFLGEAADYIRQRHV